MTLALRGAELASDGDRRGARARRIRRRCRASSTYERARHAATRAKFRFNRTLQIAVALARGSPTRSRASSQRRPDLADRLVGIAGDFVPARAAFGPGFLLDLITA